jgi:hypothetical protein
MLQPEQIDHINVVNWFTHHYPLYADDFHHFANERRCSIQQGRLLKRMGVKKGVADFYLALPTKGSAGLWIELKVGKNKLSKEQQEFLDRKNQRGYDAVSVWGWESATHILKTYMDVYEENAKS